MNARHAALQSSRPSGARPARKLPKIHASRIAAYLILALGGFICLYPLIYTVLAGFFTAVEFNQRLATMGLFPWPEHFTLENYVQFLDVSGSVGPFFVNSLLRTAYSVVMCVVVSFLSGYCFARLDFAGRRFWFLFLLFASMLPGTISLIPMYIMYARWPFAGGNMVFTGGTGLLDSFWVYLIGGPAINIMGAFLVKQFLSQVPTALDEAAKIDGAGHLTIIFRILLPLARPILIYLAVTTAIGTWNDWSTSFFFTNSDSVQTLPGAIARMSSQLNIYSIPNYPLLISLSLAVTIPSLLIFFFFQRYIVEGLAAVGVKG